MRTFLLALSACLLLAVSAPAQTAPADATKRAEEVLKKMRRIDLLNQILPLALTKQQITDLLPALEKARANVRKTERYEQEQLAKFEKELDDAIKAGIEKGVVPTREFTGKVARFYQALSINRQIAVNENLETVRPVLTKTLNAGQTKAATGLIDAAFFEPGAKKEDLTDARKLDIYIREVLLDPLAYDLLIQLSKK